MIVYGLPVLSAFLGFVLRDDEADRPPGRLGRGHQIAEGVEDLPELSPGVAGQGVMLRGQCLRGLLQIIEPAFI